jgi:hypothetical protein
MATSNDGMRSIGLDFAEFASTLISETLNAVISSILTQEKQVAELEQQATLSPEEYARENLTDEIIRTEIMQLFPSINGGFGKSSIDVGEPYMLIKENANGQLVNLVGKELIEELYYNKKEGKEPNELPSINKKVGYIITEEDLDIINIRTPNLSKTDILRYSINPDEQKLGNAVLYRVVINQTGYDRIYATTRLMLAVQHLVVINRIIKRGIPRVYVNDGHIKSKLMLSFESQTTTNTPNTTGSKITGLGIRRIIAQPVNATKPEYLTLNADILSEVEISFKTVIP